jgi:LysR family hydrogen peroxide-inducible transcriptional activator
MNKAGHFHRKNDDNRRMILPSAQQLRYLATLADHGHFGRAAATCAVTQSTLSAGILALERQLDAPLIERGATRRPVFTAIGMEVVARARLALAALEEVSEAAAAARDPLSGPAAPGRDPTIGPFLLPRLMPALRAAFPRLKLFLREEMTERLMLQLDQGKLDLLLLALPCDCAAAEQVAIAADPSCWPCRPSIASPPSPWWRSRPLAGEPCCCWRTATACACKPRRPAACPAASRGASQGGEGFAATSLHTLVQMVAGGLGLHFAAAPGGRGRRARRHRPPSPSLGSEPGAPRPPHPRPGLAPRSPRAAEFRALAPAIAAGVA